MQRSDMFQSEIKNEIIHRKRWQKIKYSKDSIETREVLSLHSLISHNHQSIRETKCISGQHEHLFTLSKRGNRRPTSRNANSNENEIVAIVDLVCTPANYTTVSNTSQLFASHSWTGRRPRFVRRQPPVEVWSEEGMVSNGVHPVRRRL